MIRLLATKFFISIYIHIYTYFYFNFILLNNIILNIYTFCFFFNYKVSHLLIIKLSI